MIRILRAKFEQGGKWNTSTKNILELIESDHPIIIEVEDADGRRYKTSANSFSGKAVLINGKITNL